MKAILLLTILWGGSIQSAFTEVTTISAPTHENLPLAVEDATRNYEKLTKSNVLRPKKIPIEFTSNFGQIDTNSNQLELTYRNESTNDIFKIIVFSDKKDDYNSGYTKIRLVDGTYAYFKERGIHSTLEFKYGALTYNIGMRKSPNNAELVLLSSVADSMIQK
ncbi:MULTISPECIES: hypothetical protein [Paenibacillus]|uniref:hypothetical protein n=1 Tax=Paenibacillus TaxID=44249 RepID=UPI0022B90E52|nr:hypothetical protein [Paenibacillus caseinilyticus]MCZ8520145.1 hypothetical protein [Paenibacillus caseinilyticus]